MPSEVKSGLPENRLIASAAIPVAIWLTFPLGALFGHEWNIHEDAMLVMVPFWIASLVGAGYLAWALPNYIRRLAEAREERSRKKLIAVGIAGLFLLTVVAFIVAMVAGVNCF